MKFKALLLTALLLFSFNVKGQVAIKTNALGWATASVNAGVEVGIGKKSTFNVTGSINPFEFKDGKKWRHWAVLPEYRYWFCEKFHGSFIGIHAIGMQYNMAKVLTGVYPELSDSRYQGWGVGAGVAYGCQWALSKHWSLELTAGVGYVYYKYEKYPCAECGTRLEKGTKHYFGPTKAALSVLYVF